jgi:hypothetical protein
MLVFILAIVTITIKLSVFTILLLSLWVFIKLLTMGNYKIALFSCIIGISILLPFISRNIITSGYPFYPSSSFAVIKKDWKYGDDQISFFRDYITAYAKTAKDLPGRDIIAREARLNLSEWLPTWWVNRSMADKFMLTLAISLFVASIIYFKRFYGHMAASMKASLLITLTGIGIWFSMAPDPRFATGFIMPLIIVIIIRFISTMPLTSKYSTKWLVIPVLSLSCLLLAYTAYRIEYYFTPSCIIEPAGIAANPFKAITCNEMNLQAPLPNDNCGDTPVPCTYESCDFFINRGRAVEDGFRGK